MPEEEILGPLALVDERPVAAPLEDVVASASVNLLLAQGDRAANHWG